MKQYQEMTREELQTQRELLEQTYSQLQAKGLKLNMARGKPGADQLELSRPLLDVLSSRSDCITESGVDCRNYGELLGIPEARNLFADYMGVSPEETIVVGSASLTFMYDCMARAMLLGVLGGEKPWSKYDKVKFLCPVPGYDRHFTICETLGIEMINIPLTEWGPDMDLVEKLTAEDETVKGIWCVPKYTNPLGGSYSDEAVRRLAILKPAAKDFRIFWDNAYAVHYVYKDTPVLNILEECKKAGNPDMVYMFGSTSKITFPGAGVAFFAASRANVDFFAKQLDAQAISWDKMNMLRHVRYFKDVAGIRAQMDKHAALLRPKFDAVLSTLEAELGGTGAGSWVKPKGGYFVTYMAMPGCASRIVSLCKEAGVVLTGAGATHPYHKDPDDSYIRIAPSFPSPNELATAMEVFCITARLATVEKLLL
ncbi:aminotransferase class I/II-fold pyridoxal phosphate-dependent enzyme [Flintibacter muris]|uniref:aminotransferase class I/II-fold pyridoxal phosphate-dependent enzyme n=1 Tax=Flintibacter muris TaxID=2941327 RepID=UPI00203E29F0|nr:aminotransferase class I/II-fold pyridoxal phosphate-dependent enzyme [Flintibacter muris]